MPIDMMHPYGQLLSTMSRRQLLDIAWKLGAVAALPMTTRTAWAQPIFRSYPFSLGVASGDPWPTSVVLWTRLAPEPLLRVRSSVIAFMWRRMA
jgi:alkaline phosphatase D